MHKVGLLGLQQGGKTIGTGQDAVAYAVLLPLQGCFLAGIGAGYGQGAVPRGAQRCQLAGEPTAAYIAGTCPARRQPPPAAIQFTSQRMCIKVEVLSWS